MSCRAMQALHLQALEPVAETLADPNSYGFRPKRSTADAIGQCFNALGSKHSAEWIFEGDITANGTDLSPIGVGACRSGIEGDEERLTGVDRM